MEQLREHLPESAFPHTEIGAEHLVQMPVHLRQKIIPGEIAGLIQADAQASAAFSTGA